MNYTYFFKEEYDKKIKYKGEKFFYSSKEDGQVVGEINGKQPENGQPSITIKGKAYAVFEYKKTSRILYKEVGYVSVGGGQCLAVMKSRKVFFLILLLAMIGIILGAMILPGLFEEDVPVSGEIPEIDPNAQVLDEGDKTPVDSGGGGSVTMEYTLNADVTLSDKNVKMHFKNPGESNHGVSLDLYVVDGAKEYLVASSGRINPGYGVYQMTLIEDYAILGAGAYNGLYKVSFYDPDTGEKALVQSKITDVVITVQ